MLREKIERQTIESEMRRDKNAQVEKGSSIFHSFQFAYFTFFFEIQSYSALSHFFLPALSFHHPYLLFLSVNAFFFIKILSKCKGIK